MKKALSILLLFLCISYCSCDNDGKSHLPTSSPTNLSHALSLVDSVKIDGETISFIYIYSEYPDYKPTGAIGEGISCVDDVGRFMEVLEKEILVYNNKSLIPVAVGMTNFLLYMSRDDGLWYNFLLQDGKINKTHQNSIAEFGWWAIRGLRGLTAAYCIFKDSPKDSVFLEKITNRIRSADAYIQESIQKYPSRNITYLGQRPAWLIKDAPDMNSELLIALTKLHRTGDFDYSEAIQKISKGLMEYQYCDKNHDLDGMYFCWKNIWHNWGNNQAYALLEAFRITGDSTLFYSVKSWADSFIPFLIENNMPREITLNSKQTYKKVDFPQIAYGINSLYRGMKSFADITNSNIYKENAESVFGWFTGQNMPRIPMYDTETGRCFDGIIGDLSVNLNSGAESTIECLLAILMRGII
ncbi:MAG: hypothetical protein ISS81_11220 [Candidatus Marinimicrobia bacterium]|nr:hypothetical protein [Candidatus Neomarinimicrobiota bacterium]